MVTREREADLRYGLGKSLGTIVSSLRDQGVATEYLTQADLGLRAGRSLAKIANLLNFLHRRSLISLETLALGFGIAERLNMGRLAAKVARRDGFSHVHCHDPIIALGYRMFGTLHRSACHWGVTEHGFGSYTQALHEDGVALSGRQMRLLRRIERAILTRAAWVISPTRSARAQLARDLAVYPIPGHWHYVPHAKPAASGMDRARARKTLGWASDELIVLGVGRLAPVKNFPALIRAVSAVTGRRPQLVIIGDGDSAPLFDAAEQAGIADRFSLVSATDASTYVTAADVYVSTALSEAFGLANLEALAAGTPAICTAAGAVPEVVGEAAWIVPIDDPFALRNAIQELITQPALRAASARRGLQRLDCWPSASDVAREYQRIYLEPGGGDSGAFSTAPADRSSACSIMPVWSSMVASFAHCPLPRTLVVQPSQRALVIAPHPDDEVLACGGTLSLLIRTGASVRVVVMSDGALGDPEGAFAGDVTEIRRSESRAALAILGVTDLVFLNLPDGAIRASAKTVQLITEEIQKFGPDMILLPPLLDQHRDHVAASLAAIQAWRSSGGEAIALMWELWQALPVNLVVDISSVFEVRRQASLEYKVALHYKDYTIANEGLAMYRGLYLDNGRYAEGLLELNAETVNGVVDHLLSMRALSEPDTR